MEIGSGLINFMTPLINPRISCTHPCPKDHRPANLVFDTNNHRRGVIVEHDSKSPVSFIYLIYIYIYIYIYMYVGESLRLPTPH